MKRSCSCCKLCRKLRNGAAVAQRAQNHLTETHTLLQIERRAWAVDRERWVQERQAIEDQVNQLAEQTRRFNTLKTEVAADNSKVMRLKEDHVKAERTLAAGQTALRERQEQLESDRAALEHDKQALRDKRSQLHREEIELHEQRAAFVREKAELEEMFEQELEHERTKASDRERHLEEALTAMQRSHKQEIARLTGADQPPKAQPNYAQQVTRLRDELMTARESYERTIELLKEECDEMRVRCRCQRAPALDPIPLGEDEESPVGLGIGVSSVASDGTALSDCTAVTFRSEAGLSEAETVLENPAPSTLALYQRGAREEAPYTDAVPLPPSKPLWRRLDEDEDGQMSVRSSASAPACPVADRPLTELDRLSLQTGAKDKRTLWLEHWWFLGEVEEMIENGVVKQMVGGMGTKARADKLASPWQSRDEGVEQLTAEPGCGDVMELTPELLSQPEGGLSASEEDRVALSPSPDNLPPLPPVVDNAREGHKVGKTPGGDMFSPRLDMMSPRSAASA